MQYTKEEGKKKNNNSSIIVTYQILLTVGFSLTLKGESSGCVERDDERERKRKCHKESEIDR